MSYQPQGPDWWKASDGMWHPPQPRAAEQAPSEPPYGGGSWQASDGSWHTFPPPYKSSKRMSAFLEAHPFRSVGMAVLGLIVIVALVVAANKGAFRGHPALADIDQTTKTCAIDDADYLTYGGTLTNHSSGTSDYTIHVDFVANGIRVADGVTFVNHVASGQTAQWSVNSLSQVPSPSTCRITSISRMAS
jgi:hypothetical protein